MPDRLPVDKEKKTRIVGWQLEVLQQEFANNRFPDTQRKMKLALKLGMTVRKVQIWFQNARARDKRNNRREPYFVK